MAVRILTLTKSKLTDTGLALLDWGYWSGKPDELGNTITVPVWRDLYYSHSVFQITVHPPGREHDNTLWSIGKQDLERLSSLDVNDWWNQMAEAIMKRIDDQGLLIALPETVSHLPTRSYSRQTPTPRRITRQS